MADGSGIVVAPAVAAVRLDLGAGQSPREGFDAVDLNAPNPAYRVDLFKFPWPFADSSVDELHASHFIEHIPAREIETRDMARAEDQHEVGRTESATHYVGQDMLLAFCDECYRILKPDGVLTLIWPALKSHRAFQDPTHRRFIPGETLCYLVREWREANRLDHYRVRCNFSNVVTHTCPQELTMLHPEAQARRFNESWNTIYDFHATLRKLP